MVRRLSQDERSQLYAIGREKFAEVHRERGQPLRNLRKVKLAVKEHLTGIGWEQILINLAIQLIVPWIIHWLESLVADPSFEPPAAMPELFGEEVDLDA